LSRTGWVLISLVAVAVAYGAWLAISYRTEQRPAEFSSYTPSPQTVPEVIVEAPEPEPSSPAPDAAASSPRTDAAPEVPPTAPPTATPPTSPAPVPRADTTPPPAAVPATPPRQPTPAPRADATPAQPPSRPAAPATPPAAQSAPRSGATPGSVASVPANPVAPPASGPGAGYNVPQATETEDDPDVTPEPEDSVASGSPGPAAGRVVIRARQDSWVQIQASNGTTVFARTLRAGESFAVPEQTGLRLTTGNAGAIEVMVDGQSAPSLGQVGAVRRNVSLDANRLKAGTALE
jgi:cytoskeleton protein RodZ